MTNTFETAAAYADDEIDLRLYMEVLLKAKWLIAGITLAGILLAGFLSFAVLDPTYEATVVVTLPPARGQSGSIVRLGMSPEAYHQLATSLPVMEAIYERTGAHLGPEVEASSLYKRFETRLDKDGGLLEVTVKGGTAEEAHLLASTWRQVYQETVHRHIEDQLAASMASVGEQVQQAAAAFEQAQEALATFDREHGLSIIRSRLEQLERELTSAESRLRSLTMDLLPAERARLQFLEAMLAHEPTSLEASIGQAYVPGSSPGGTVVSSVTVLNPAYLQYSEDLAATGSRIASYEAEAAALQEKLARLPEEVAQVRAELLRLETERDQLVLQRDSARTRLMEAVKSRDALSPLSARLRDLTRVEVVSPAVLPLEPVSPRPLLNMAVAAVLFFFGAVLYVFIREWWRGTPDTSVGTAHQ